MSAEDVFGPIVAPQTAYHRVLTRAWEEAPAGRIVLRVRCATCVTEKRSDATAARVVETATCGLLYQASWPAQAPDAHFGPLGGKQARGFSVRGDVLLQWHGPTVEPRAYCAQHRTWLDVDRRRIRAALARHESTLTVHPVR